MKDIFKRCAVLFMALAMVFSLCGCVNGCTRVNVRIAESNRCGSFTVSGRLGNAGTVTLTGKLPRFGGNYYQSVNNQKYTYTRSGNNVTFTRKGGTSYDGPKSVSGTYNSKTNTFTVRNANYCL